MVQFFTIYFQFDETKTFEKEQETVKTEIVEEIEISCFENYSENEVAVKLENEESDFVPISKTPKKTRRLPSILQKRQKRQKLSIADQLQARQAGQFRQVGQARTSSAFTIGHKRVQDENRGTKMVPILKKQAKNPENQEASSQNRIILPKARNAIHGIAIGNPVKIKVNQKLRNPSSDSDKSTNENPKIIAPMNNLPMLQPKPVITPPPVRDDNYK